MKYKGVSGKESESGSGKYGANGNGEKPSQVISGTGENM